MNRSKVIVEDHGRPLEVSDRGCGPWTATRLDRVEIDGEAVLDRVAAYLEATQSEAALWLGVCVAEGAEGPRPG